jgi:hypothetical protein
MTGKPTKTETVYLTFLLVVWPRMFFVVLMSFCIPDVPFWSVPVIALILCVPALYRMFRPKQETGK